MNLENTEVLNEQENLEGTEAAAAEKKEYQLEDGTMGSRSAYIRQEFKKDRSRGDIAKELGIAYYIVYSATANMYNAAHPEGATGGFGNRGTMIEIELEDGTKKTVSRAEAMRADLANGMSRGEIAKKYDCPYATVYAATKDEETEGGSKGGKKMVVDPRDGVEKPRVEVIRSMYEEGKEKENIRREIATALGVDYAVVWAATKEKKEEVATPEDATVAEGTDNTAEMTDEELEAATAPESEVADLEG